MWDIGQHPDEVPLAAPPRWLLALLTSGRRPVATGTTDTQTMCQGQRNGFAPRSSMRTFALAIGS